MAPASRWSLSDPQTFAVGVLIVAGVFILACGTGMSNIAVGGLGVAVAVLGPLLIMMTGLRAGGREYTYGRAQVIEVSDPPFEGNVGLCEMDLLVNAHGSRGVPAQVRDLTVPVDKWPAVGALLPVMVSVRDPREIRVIWDEVRPHRTVSIPDDTPIPEEADIYPDVDEPYDETAQEADDAYGYGEPAPVTTYPDLDDVPPRPPTSDRDPADLTAVANPTPGAPDDAYLDEAADPTDGDVDEVYLDDATPADDEDPDDEDPDDRDFDDSAHADDAAPDDPDSDADIIAAPEAAGLIGRPLPAPHRAGPGPATAPADVPAPVAVAEPDQVAVPAPNAGVSVTLIVSDLQRSLRFYHDTLGLTVEDTAVTTAVLSFGDARVVLRQVTDMPPIDRRLAHLNLDVPDVEEAYDRLRAKGVEFVHRPRVVQQGEHLELYSATFRDPDGHAIAITRWTVRR